LIAELTRRAAQPDLIARHESLEQMQIAVVAAGPHGGELLKKKAIKSPQPPC
jgi:hypothetical protein